ncbi:hypothetical protein L7F22_000806 [Adiantum nelumboides]|nr:hypothetical protein [Adiantum nelumboides]
MNNPPLFGHSLCTVSLPSSPWPVAAPSQLRLLCHLLVLPTWPWPPPLLLLGLPSCSRACPAAPPLCTRVLAADPVRSSLVALYYSSAPVAGWARQAKPALAPIRRAAPLTWTTPLSLLGWARQAKSARALSPSPLVRPAVLPNRASLRERLLAVDAAMAGLGGKAKPGPSCPCSYTASSASGMLLCL